MSFGAVLAPLPADLPAAEFVELPEGFVPPLVGTVVEVRARLEAAFPGHEHSDGQSAVRADGSLVLLDAICDEDGMVTCVGVTCGGEAAELAVIQIASEALGLRPLDCQTGELMDFGPATEESARAFREFRDLSLGRRA
jgi:hypothetical protein